MNESNQINKNLNFYPYGPNKPFARNIANSTEISRVTGFSTSPHNLDDKSRIFIMDFLRHHYPDVYGVHATRNTNGIITTQVVILLKRD